MSINSQIHHDPEGYPLPDPGHPVAGYARTYADKHRTPAHDHAHGQLLYAISGLMRVETAQGVWVVPPQRAVWIPAGMKHRVVMVGEVEMRSLYVLESLEGLPKACQVISVSPLLRETIAAFTAARPDYARQGPESRLASVILDLLRAPVRAALHLPMPGAARLRPIVEAILADPADPRGLRDWAGIAGASARTLARLFEAEAGMGFRAWRQQVRLHAALARLSAGEAVTGVAYAVGYDSPSAFIAMFRKALGASPRAYLRESSLPPGSPDV